MTDLTSALNATTLGEFDGREVRRTTIALTNAGDGLSEAMKIDPQVMHVGDTEYLVIEAECAKVRFERIKDSEDLVRVHVLKAGTATMVDGALVEGVIQAQREKNELAREAEEGTQRLPFDDELQALHDQGAHAGGLVPECAGCALEEAAVRVEAEDEGRHLAAVAAFPSGDLDDDEAASE